jgi:5-methylcytosine-specific restriction endonuclease McrBC GTP-binding regulatory subunit McrB
METRKTILERELEKLMNQLDPGSNVVDSESDNKNLIDIRPGCLSIDEFISGSQEKDEINILNRLKNYLRGQELFFPNRVVDAFHTSLKCHSINPLTVLAGVSGTGKTLLPVRYAEFMGMHHLVLSVQPRWDSPQDLFGFYNYLEKKYKATNLSRALYTMDPFIDQDDDEAKIFQKRLLLVLLDEMNLARTEYYFSEFLSKLELRRLVNDPSKLTQRLHASLELDSGPGGQSKLLWVPQNVLFVGTMNEDESTQSLSDKVLDRSNLLRFGKPETKSRDNKDLSHQISQRNQNNSSTNKTRTYLPASVWQGWIRDPKKVEIQKKIIDDIDDLNENMNILGRPFGYRVIDAIKFYIVNYPSREQPLAQYLAFADQIEQKILPKLRGLDVSGDSHRKALIQIGNIIAKLEDKELEKAFANAQHEATSQGLFHWIGVSRSVEEQN